MNSTVRTFRAVVAGYPLAAHIKRSGAVVGAEIEGLEAFNGVALNAVQVKALGLFMMDVDGWVSDIQATINELIGVE